MNRILLGFLILGLTLTVNAADNKKMPVGNDIYGDPVELQKMFGPLIARLPQCEIDASRDAFMKLLEDIAVSLDKGQFAEKPILTRTFSLFSSSIAGWVQGYKYFELDTNISKGWVKKVYNVLKELERASAAMDMAEKQNDKKMFDANKKIYNDLIDVYIKTIKNPEKPESKKKEQLKVLKVKEHKQYMDYMKKFKKKGGGDDDDDEAPAKSAGKK